MNHEFWLERWTNQQIGFHLDQVNPNLLKFYPQLNLSAPSQILIPLCGKTKDILYFYQEGHHVTGVELSQIAADEFFQENNLTPHIEKQEKFIIYFWRDSKRTGSITFVVGDFFQWSELNKNEFDLVYDRASMIALPTELRTQYVLVLQKLRFHKIFLITLSYNQTLVEGPPFSVSPQDVSEFYKNFKIEELDNHPSTREIPTTEHVFLIRRNE
jgi:thiopurine S-methyltransferase